MLHAVIMAGGVGTRFWPMSRAACPKQLLDLLGGRTMIQTTVDRLAGLATPQQTYVITNQSLVAAISQQLPELPKQQIIGEPCKRDTAPCIGLAAALVSRVDEDATMVVMPADHVIGTGQQFREAISYGVKLVEEDPQRIVTFGISPSYPAETYGYIERGEPLGKTGSAKAGLPTFGVQRFREKPTAEVAREFIESGSFYWNSGIFVWKAKTITDALSQYEPAMHRHIQTIADALESPDFDEVLTREFTAIEGKSIDYAVMEHYENVVVIEAPFTWDDLGNWQSLARLRGTDEQGNTILGKHIGLSTEGSIVRSDDGHLIVTMGLKDCIVVHTPDATLVANKHDEESIRKVVELIKQNGWDEYL